MSVIQFDPADLALKHIGGRYQLWAGRQFLKDLGPNERDATDAAHTVRDLGFNQFGAIAGSSPSFEFWLTDGGPAKGGLAAKNVNPFSAKTLKVEQVGGAWVLRDDKQMLYNFGHQEEAARRAYEIVTKHGFNQLGVVGVPRPVLTYLTIDPFAHPTPVAPRAPDARELLSKLSEQGLMLPNVGYIGARLPIEYRKLEAVRVQNEWVLAHGKDVLGRFGADSKPARDALRVFQDARITEVDFVGRSGLPIYLCTGQAPRFAGLGINNVRFQPAQLKAVAINNVWCVVDGGRILFEFGDNRADAELVVKVLQHFQFDEFCPIGDVNHGGIRLFVRTR
jgi:hypothetical protein